MSPQHIASNKRRAGLVVAAFVSVLAAVVGTLTLLIGIGPAGLMVAPLLAGACAALAWWKSDAVVLALSRARPADPRTFARLHNLVEGLCIAAGLPKPGLFVIEDPGANAFATGRGPRHASLVVTTGLLDTMSRVELEAVLAHELSHVKNYDVLVSTLAATLIGLPLLLAGPLVGRLVNVAVSRSRETVADTTGVALTRYPPGLIAALEKLRTNSSVVSSWSRATAHLWIQSPLATDATGGPAPTSIDTHPPLDERISVLKEL